MTGAQPISVPAWTGCLGLEPTVEMFVAHIVLTMRDVWRVLRKDGTLWLNFGDTYYGSGKGRNADGTHSPGGKQATNKGSAVGELPKKQKAKGLKPKDLIGIPWRVAFALQADGWYLRSDIIWHKSNPMPESVRDRPTKAHEYIFLFSKSRQYYFDAEAIKEDAVGASGGQPKKIHHESAQGHHGKTSALNASWFGCELRNKRSVWTFSTAQLPEAHFAVFPDKLPETAILAGSSPQACPLCAAPWKRKIVKTGHINKWKTAHVPGNTATKSDSTGWAHTSTGTDIFEPTCKCENNDGSAKCQIFDPFGGSGTTRKVALENNRECTLIDINPAYVEMQERRTAIIQPKLF